MPKEKLPKQKKKEDESEGLQYMSINSGPREFSRVMSVSEYMEMEDEQSSKQDSSSGEGSINLRKQHKNLFHELSDEASQAHSYNGKSTRRIRKFRSFEKDTDGSELLATDSSESEDPMENINSVQIRLGLIPGRNLIFFKQATIEDFEEHWQTQRKGFLGSAFRRRRKLLMMLKPGKSTPINPKIGISPLIANNSSEQLRLATATTLAAWTSTRLSERTNMRYIFDEINLPQELRDKIDESPDPTSDKKLIAAVMLFMENPSKNHDEALEEIFG